jgi:hypothetical protein
VRNVAINGQFIQLSAPGIAFTPMQPAPKMQFLDGNTLEQSRFRGATAPTTAREITLQLTLDPVARETDQRLLALVTAVEGQRVELYLDAPLVDRWVVSAGQTAFSTFRTLAYGHIAGVSAATRPPLAFLDGAEQAIVTSGTPSAGEVLVPDSAGQHQAIEVPAGTATGSQLLLYSYCTLLGVFTGSFGYTEFNHQSVRLTFDERPVGDWS